jgi:two-component system sensor histidine kinase VicK
MLGIDARKKHTFDSIFEKYSIPVTFEQALSDDEKEVKSCVLEIGENVIALHFAPYKTEYKKADGVVVALQDITKQQRLDDSRRAFVADVSHELRTPLTNIKSYSETLLDADIDDEATRTSFLKVIDSEADRMTRLVKDLLALSQLDHSKQHLKPESFSLGALVENIVNTMSMDAKKRGQILTYVKGGESAVVFADKDRINQVIVNIVSNALKYTPEGGNITVVSGQQEQNAYIKISDTGMGIPEKDLPHIFDRFYRVDKARSRKMGGTGLGLAIAKEIVEAHEGTISIDSVYGEGTTVTIKLPIEQTERMESDE